MDRIYRGWRLERAENVTQLGHRTNAGTLARVGIGTRRQISGWWVHYPDSESGGTRWADTLADAKRYVDSYLGN